MNEMQMAVRGPVRLFAAGVGLVMFLTVGLAEQGEKGKDDKPAEMSYTVTKQKLLFKVVLKNSPLGPEYEMSIDTTPKNSAGIRNEVPVAVSYKIKEHAIDVDMLPGAKGVKSVRFDGKKVPLAKAERPATKPKEAKEDKNDKPGTPEEKAAQLLAGAKQALESKNTTLARLRLQGIVRDYATTAAAKEAEKLLKTLSK